jgi:hypothetical protein
MAHDVFVFITHLVERSHHRSVALEVSASTKCSHNDKRPNPPRTSLDRVPMIMNLTKTVMAAEHVA